MGKFSVLIAFGLLLVSLQKCARAQLNQQRPTSCLQLENCMNYFESPTCGADGRRQVCLNWVDFAGCNLITDPAMEGIGICRMNDVGTIPLLVGQAATQCDSVLGGTSYRFGIQATLGTDPTAAGSISVSGYTRGLAVCDGFDSICMAGGNNDFGLTFQVGDCPTTTTPTTTTAPTTTTVATTTQPGCSCAQWSQWSTCTLTCGPFATRTRTRTCTNCGTPGPVLSETGRCPGAHVSCPINGGWSNWGPFAGCTATCGAGTNTRTRTCTNPPPQFGGSPCPGSDREIIACVLAPTCPGGGGGGGGGGGARRRCRRRARRNQCEGLTRRALKRCLNRACN